MNKKEGINANKPWKIPFSGWKQVLKRVKEQMDKNKIALMAAGVAFYFFFALFPAVLAIVSLYALVTDPMLIRDHVDELKNYLPAETHDFVSDKLENILDVKDSSQGWWGLALSFIISIGSANKGIFYLFRAINEVYDEKSKRGMIKQNAITLAFTFGILIVGILSLGIIIGYPVVREELGLPGVYETILSYGRWIILAVIIFFCIAVIYKYAPQRRHPKFQWVSMGAVFATFLWLIGSLLLTLYIQHFDQIEELYGQISALIILLIWLNISTFAIVLGAQINAELEHQTRKDTTQGKEKPMGERSAHFADHVAADDMRN